MIFFEIITCFFQWFHFSSYSATICYFFQIINKQFWSKHAQICPQRCKYKDKMEKLKLSWQRHPGCCYNYNHWTKSVVFVSRTESYGRVANGLQNCRWISRVSQFCVIFFLNCHWSLDSSRNLKSHQCLQFENKNASLVFLQSLVFTIHLP